MTQTSLRLLYWRIAEEIFYYGNFGAALQLALVFMRTLRSFMRSDALRLEKFHMVKLWRSIQRMFVEIK